jgi:hypothetical protein
VVSAVVMPRLEPLDVLVASGSVSLAGVVVFVSQMLQVRLGAVVVLQVCFGCCTALEPPPPSPPGHAVPTLE